MNDVMSVIQLENYFFERITCKIHKNNENPLIDITPKLSFNKEKKKASVVLDFIVEDEKVSVKGTLRGFFSYTESLEEPEIKNLIFINGITILFPYLRAGISNFTNTANLPSLLLPTFNIVEYFKAKYEDSEASVE